MDVFEQVRRARELVASGDADEKTKAAVNALAGAVERLAEDTTPRTPEDYPGA